jgi:hypothetical protein
MDMLEGAGRRHGKTGVLVTVEGGKSLNGRERNLLFRNDGDGTFTDVGWVNAADRVEDGRGLAVADLDRDGRQDLVLRNFLMPAHLLRNAGPARRWLQLELVGTTSNRDAVGAKVRVRAGDRWQTGVVGAGSGFRSSSSRVQHFGLGDVPVADEVTIRWPSGQVTSLRDLAADRRWVVREGDEVVTPARMR